MGPRYKEPIPPPPPRYCRCGARLARDNRDDECSPCQASSAARERERLAAAEELRRNRSRSMRQMQRDLTLEDVPLCGSYDRLGPDLVRECVYWWAKTLNWDTVADETELQRMEVRRCMERDSARELVALMIEEGVWPEGAPTGRRAKRASANG